MSSVLATTTSEGLQPLGSAAQRSYELVSGALRDRLGEAHARLLAEPVAAEHGDRIDWHAPVPGRAVPVDGLSPHDRAALGARLSTLTAEILAEAGRLRADGSAEARRLAEALANAVEVPSDAYIHALQTDAGWQPVLVHWAWRGDAGQSVRGALSGRMPARGAQAASGPVVTVWDNPAWLWLIWLGWFLLAALLALILWLMLHPCGLAPLGPDYCRAEPQAIAAVHTEQDVLQDRVSALQREIALANRSCQPTVPVAPARDTADPPAIPVPERKGALPPVDPPTLLRLAGLAQALYTRVSPWTSSD